MRAPLFCFAPGVPLLLLLPARTESWQERELLQLMPPATCAKNYQPESCKAHEAAKGQPGRSPANHLSAIRSRARRRCTQNAHSRGLAQVSVRAAVSSGARGAAPWRREKKVAARNSGDSHATGGTTTRAIKGALPRAGLARCCRTLSLLAHQRPRAQRDVLCAGRAGRQDSRMAARPAYRLVWLWCCLLIGAAPLRPTCATPLPSPSPYPPPPSTRGPQFVEGMPLAPPAGRRDRCLELRQSVKPAATHQRSARGFRVLGSSHAQRSAAAQRPMQGVAVGNCCGGGVKGHINVAGHVPPDPQARCCD